MTGSLARDSIFFTGTLSSKRDLARACWDSTPGVSRGVVVVVGALYILFLMRRLHFGDGSVAQKLMHFCPRGIPNFPSSYSRC